MLYLDFKAHIRLNIAEYLMGINEKHFRGTDLAAQKRAETKEKFRSLFRASLKNSPPQVIDDYVNSEELLQLRTRFYPLIMNIWVEGKYDTGWEEISPLEKAMDHLSDNPILWEQEMISGCYDMFQQEIQRIERVVDNLVVYLTEEDFDCPEIYIAATKKAIRQEYKTPEEFIKSFTSMEIFSSQFEVHIERFRLFSEKQRVSDSVIARNSSAAQLRTQLYEKYYYSPQAKAIFN